MILLYYYIIILLYYYIIILLYYIIIMYMRFTYYAQGSTYGWQIKLNYLFT